MTVKKTHKCKVCGKTINSEDVRAPRNTRPQDTEVVDGVCSDRCQNELLLRDAASGAKDLGGKVLDSLNPFK